MSCTEILKARVSLGIKQQAKALAERDLMTESAWLKKLVVRELRAVPGSEIGERETCRMSSARKASHGPRRIGSCDRPIFVRLKPDDRLLLDARAEARGMRPATYAAVLLRAHLRQLTPVPKEELLALKRTIGELAAIGRNINQITPLANEGGRLPGSVREEFRAMLKICEALRDNTKDLLKANLKSWGRGHGEDV